MIKYLCISFLILTTAGCGSTFFLMDTTSDSVYEYKNDFYVSHLDSSVEIHYELWSRDANLWLSTLNKTDRLLFLILDSTYVMHQGDKYSFDFLVDWAEYSASLSTVPDLTDYDFDRVLPLVPGRWKGMLGSGFPISVKDWEDRDPVDIYDRETSPFRIDVKVCFYVEGNAFTPICKEDAIWVESFTPVDGNTIRSLERDQEYNKADKFYITNSNWFTP